MMVRSDEKTVPVRCSELLVQSPRRIGGGNRALSRCLRLAPTPQTTREAHLHAIERRRMHLKIRIQQFAGPEGSKPVPSAIRSRNPRLL